MQLQESSISSSDEPQSGAIASRMLSDEISLKMTIVIYNKEIFHPIPNNINIQLDSLEAATEIVKLKEIFVTDKSVGIHWWQRSWQI